MLPKLYIFFYIYFSCSFWTLAFFCVECCHLNVWTWLVLWLQIMLLIIVWPSLFSRVRNNLVCGFSYGRFQLLLFWWVLTVKVWRFTLVVLGMLQFQLVFWEVRTITNGWSIQLSFYFHSLFFFLFYTRIKISLVFFYL